jgi:NACHT domain- and WD repeat-containing protein
MTSTDNTYRVFVSSTFSDLTAERNALARHVFPRLRDLCASYGGRFMAVDLRWGVSEEAGLDQRGMRVCLGEIARCQELSPRPNFLVLLGDRYGWRPLPEEIPADVFQSLAAGISSDARPTSRR